MKYTKSRKTGNRGIGKRLGALITALAVFVTQTGFAATLSFVPLQTVAAEESSRGKPSDILGEMEVDEAFSISNLKGQKLVFNLEIITQTTGFLLPKRFIDQIFQGTILIADQGPFVSQTSSGETVNPWTELVDPYTHLNVSMVEKDNVPAVPTLQSPQGGAYVSVTSGKSALNWSEVEPSVPEAGPVVYRYAVMHNNTPLLTETTRETEAPIPFLVKENVSYQWKLQACDQVIKVGAQKTVSSAPTFNHCSDWSNPASFKGDNTPPQVDLKEVNQGEDYASGTLTLTATANDAKSGLENTAFRILAHEASKPVKVLKAEELAEEENTFTATWDTPSLSDGTYQVHFYAEDSVGNGTQEKSSELTLDNQDPGITITSPSSAADDQPTYVSEWNGTLKGTTTGDIKPYTDAGNEVRLRITRTSQQNNSSQVWTDGGWVPAPLPNNQSIALGAELKQDGSWTYTVPQAQREQFLIKGASYAITASAAEAFANDNQTVSDRIEVVYDSEKPEEDKTELTKPHPETQYVNGKVSLEGKTHDRETTVRNTQFVIVRNENVITTLAGTKHDSRWQATWNTVDENIQDGEYAIRFQATDRAGNTSRTDQRTVTLDNTDPKVTIDTPKNDKGEVTYTNSWDGRIAGTTSGDVSTVRLVLHKSPDEEDMRYVWNAEAQAWQETSEEGERIDVTPQDPPQGEWNYTLPSEEVQAATTYTLHAYATEKHAEEPQEVSSRTHTLKYDTESPQGSWQLKLKNNQSKVSVQWEMTDASGIDKYHLNGVQPAKDLTFERDLGDDQSSVVLPNLAAGTWNMSFKAEDKAGNIFEDTKSIRVKAQTNKNQENTSSGENKENETEETDAPSEEEPRTDREEQDSQANEPQGPSHTPNEANTPAPYRERETISFFPDSESTQVVSAQEEADTEEENTEEGETVYTGEGASGEAEEANSSPEYTSLQARVGEFFSQGWSYVLIGLAILLLGYGVYSRIRNTDEN